jgi:hypothetical protein
MTVLPPPTLETLQGSWLGGDADDSEFYLRLEIDRTGRGILAAQFDASERPAVYEVLSANLTEFAIEFEVWPKDGAEPIYLRGTTYGSSMKLEAGNTEHRWRRKAILEPEHAVLSRIEAVTRRVHEVDIPGK